MTLGIFGSARVASGSVTYRTAVLADSPYCYFPLDDATTPTDVMGVVTPSAVTGVTLGVAGIGDGATAASFNGGASNGGVILPNAQLPAINTTTSMTFEVLAQATNMTAQRVIFARENLVLLRHSSGSIIRGYTGVNGWANQIGSDYTETSQTAVHHWAIVWDGANVTLYRDGVSIATEASVGTLASATQNMHIGGRSTETSFLGTIAGFAYYTSALSSTRILAHAQAAGLA